MLFSPLWSQDAVLPHVGFEVRKPHPFYLGRQRELPGSAHAAAPVAAGIEVWRFSCCVTGVYGPAVTQTCSAQAWEIRSGQTESLSSGPNRQLVILIT